ncbi:SRPBCC domain-containing protein [Amycolatopsis rhabdoformis]|uniref:SRPBCC domain-containing protein n=1 Tax=Amycolatopsis rhabdoformis TaxID=1448059 RepID=A0ABZ1IBL4_9PSEU|nr:SRPBCC domain-containing protein [Amycolatopsis rhabdoformis]WSE30835.1 SRPBCC domain-containing protein [Amycolatopsis rhabdoformis]
MTHRDLTITRVFDAPRELVFRAWTEPEQLASWLGPEDFAASVAKLDLRAGGAWRARIHSEKHGVARWMQGAYREISPPGRLVFTFSWDDPQDVVGETLVTITLADVGDKTEMTFHQAPFPTEEERAGHHDGWSSTFDDLARYLEEAR